VHGFAHVGGEAGAALDIEQDEGALGAEAALHGGAQPPELGLSGVVGEAAAGEVAAGEDVLGFGQAVVGGELEPVLGLDGVGAGAEAVAEGGVEAELGGGKPWAAACWSRLKPWWGSLARPWPP
jgi:hypothetical protein